MEYRDTRYDFIKIGSDGEVYSTYKGLYKKKCSIRKGIKTFRVKLNGNKKTVGVAKLVAQLYIPNPKKYRYVKTRNGDEMDTRPENLYWSKSNRMDYRNFSKKKTGMKYKSYVGKIKGDYKVIEENRDNCVLSCISCGDKKTIKRKLLRSNGRICYNCKDTSLDKSLLKSDMYKNWIVVEQEKSKDIRNKSKKWVDIKCKCCGEKKTIKYINFANKKTVQNCKIKKKLVHRLKNKFNGMKQRCYNPDCKSYKSYGGRGIKICDEWLLDPDSFVEWSLKNGYELGLEIDRIEGGGNYEPSNCQFLTRKKNSVKQYTNVVDEKFAKKIKHTDWGNMDNRQIADTLGLKKQRKRYGSIIGNIRRGKTWKHV